MVNVNVNVNVNVGLLREGERCGPEMAPYQPETGRIADVQLSQKLARVDAVPRVVAVEPRDEGRPAVLGMCQK